MTERHCGWSRTCAAPHTCREDDPLIAMDFSQTLLEAGYVVIGPANSVVRELALLAQFGCDAATLDVNLGAEKTSEAIARELIRLGMPFIATCGYSREQMPEIMLRRGKTLTLG